jgi:hypothetical protein
MCSLSPESHQGPSRRLRIGLSSAYEKDTVCSIAFMRLCISFGLLVQLLPKKKTHCKISLNCLDSFDALRVKDVYAPKRKQGEREH